MALTEASLATFALLHDLEVEYWYTVDRKHGAGAEDFYINDGVFVVGEQRMRGRAEIAAFYRWRAGLGPRTARHLIANPKLTAAADDTATFECVMSLFAADGIPVLDSRPAIMMADVVSTCVRCDGRWLFAAHILTPVFMGGVRPTIPSRDQLAGALQPGGDTQGPSPEVGRTT